MPELPPAHVPRERTEEMAKTGSKSYEPAATEKQIWQLWLDGGYFHPQPDERPRDKRFCIMIPLPNVTAALHLGHALNNTLQDVLTRYKRMAGCNTLWMLGTDHAGIATQAMVEKSIFEKEKKNRHDLGREELVRRIWEWKGKFGGRIIEQLKIMGCSGDYQRERFTLDEVCAKAVRHTFFKFFKDGLIYRGKRLVNWDTHLQTAVADDEVYHETVKGHFWYIRYPLLAANEVQIPELGGRRYEIPPDIQAAALSRATAPGAMFGRDYVLIATTRPETMLGDTAVAVHPNPKKALEKIESALQEKMRQATEKEKPSIAAQMENVIERHKTCLPALVNLQSANNTYVMLPLLNLQIPVIRDEWADPSLGTGCVKITPAHDPNDYEVGKRHECFVSMVNVMTPDGRVNVNGGAYQGLKFADARKRIVEDLEKLGLVEKIEDRMIDLAHSDRSKTPIEPFLSDQWFVKMGDLPPERAKKIEGLRGASGLNQLAMDAVTSGRIHFFPERYASSYLDWLAEKRDWCISRQLWWGHRIPAWSVVFEFEADTVEDALESLGVLAILRELPAGIVALIRVWRTREEPHYEESSGEVIDAKMYEELAEGVLVKSSQDSRIALEHKQMGQKDIADLGGIGAGRIELTMAVPGREYQARLESLGFEQDPDVLDTWFSSALWPHSTLGWPDADPTDPKSDLGCWYPTNVLITAREIITLWVARMVMTGLYNVGDIPFSDVIIHSVIQDGQGRKMSKTLGNGVDPQDIIEEYGADALRFTLADLATETQDIRLPVTPKKLPDGRTINVSEKFEKGRNFCNKLWQASTGYVMSNLDGYYAKPLAVGVLRLEDRWILSRMTACLTDLNEALARYRFSEAMKVLYRFMWDEYCSWYIEMTKPRLIDPNRAETDQSRDRKGADERAADDARGTAQQLLVYVLDQLLRMLHPFIPFVTEGVWQKLNEQARHRGLTEVRECEPALIAAAWPSVNAALRDERVEADMAALHAIIKAVREIRTLVNDYRSRAKQPSMRTLPAAIVRTDAETCRLVDRYRTFILPLAGCDALTVAPDAAKPHGAMSRVEGSMEVYVPVGELIDLGAVRKAEQAKLEELSAARERAERQLRDENFVQRANPAVVAQARQRVEDYVNQIRTIEQHLAEME